MWKHYAMNSKKYGSHFVTSDKITVIQGENAMGEEKGNLEVLCDRYFTICEGHDGKSKHNSR